MGSKKPRKQDPKLQNRVGELIRRATLTTGELIIPRELMGYAFSNVGKVREDMMRIFSKEIGRNLEKLFDNYSVKIKAEIHLERKKDRRQ